MADKDANKNVDYSLTKKEIKFSDVIGVQSKADVFLLTFTQNRPGGEHMCIAEIAMPPEVAASLGVILINHAAKYEKNTGRTIIPEGIIIKTKHKNQTKH